MFDNNEQIFNDAKFQNAWDSLCDNLQKLAILVEDYYYENCGRKLQESSDEEEFEKKFKYLIRIINENIDTIIRCLGFDPYDNKDKNSIFRLVSLAFFDPKKDFERNLPKENLIKLSGKIQSLLHKFRRFAECSNEDPLEQLRIELSKSLDKFDDYIKAYNELNPSKELSTLSWCLIEWFKTNDEFKKSILNQWNKDLKL